METRRKFIEKVFSGLGVILFGRQSFGKIPSAKITDKDIRRTVYRAVNGRPELNLAKVIELMGGIEKIIGADDVVLIKPNVQWWNQGAPNLAAVKRFIELIMGRTGGFNGEIVLAENCHRGDKPWTSSHSGWAPVFSRNSDIEGISNYNELSSYLKKTYGNRFTVSHWIDADTGGKRVNGPADGPGYVYCDGTNGVPLISFDNGVIGDEYREVIMSYPVFKTDKGTIVDFKNGIWKKDSYTGQPLKFINFSALNHHSTYCGATSSVKNYLGISDISGGSDPHTGGKLTGEYYNFHSFPFNKWSPGPEPGMLGAEIGVFMNSIRKADLNITTAEWTGLASRTEPPVAHTKAVLASTDPVALDYHACKYLLYPNSGIPIHNPDEEKRPLYQYLMKCAEKGGNVFNENKVAVKSYDFKTRTFQADSHLAVVGEKQWGSNIKNIGKYLVLKFF